MSKNTNASPFLIGGLVIYGLGCLYYLIPKIFESSSSSSSSEIIQENTEDVFAIQNPNPKAGVQLTMKFNDEKKNFKTFLELVAFMKGALKGQNWDYQNFNLQTLEQLIENQNNDDLYWKKNKKMIITILLTIWIFLNLSLKDFFISHEIQLLNNYLPNIP